MLFLYICWQGGKGSGYQSANQNDISCAGVWEKLVNQIDELLQVSWNQERIPQDGIPLSSRGLSAGPNSRLYLVVRNATAPGSRDRSENKRNPSICRVLVV